MFIVLSSTLFQKFRNLHGLCFFITLCSSCGTEWDTSCGMKSSLWTTDVFPVVASLPPKNNVYEPEWQNDVRDIKRFALMFFFCNLFLFEVFILQSTLKVKRKKNKQTHKTKQNKKTKKEKTINSRQYLSW